METIKTHTELMESKVVGSGAMILESLSRPSLSLTIVISKLNNNNSDTYMGFGQTNQLKIDFGFDTYLLISVLDVTVFDNAGKCPSVNDLVSYIEPARERFSIKINEQLKIFKIKLPSDVTVKHYQGKLKYEIQTQLTSLYPHH